MISTVPACSLVPEAIVVVYRTPPLATVVYTVAALGEATMAVLDICPLAGTVLV